jgi:arginyl-tRNA synthetase
VGAGFININVTDEFLLGCIKSVLDNENLGIPQCEEEQTIFLDYGGPNVAKPLHIGHLRSAIIGESLKRLAKATGRKTVADVHLGDWGLQMGLVIAGLEERHPEWDCFSADFDPESFGGIDIGAEELNEIYPAASKKSKEDDDFKAKARAITAKLQKGDPAFMALWREIIRVSVADIKSNYEKLGVDFDLWYGESDAEKYVDGLVKLLESKGLLYESEGAMVVDVAQESDKVTIPPVIIKKSDNSNIYATTDLATIMQRVQDYNPDEIWYVVDSRQSLHFTQVFRCAEKSGAVSQKTKLEHLGFGTMNGSDGKPYKTRDGGVMKLSDFYNTVYEAAHKRVMESNFSKDADKEDIARKITVATIKFGDLINHRMKDYVFDLDKFMAADGKTGSFLLYTIARINSILKKSGYEQKSFDSRGIYSDAERDLIMKLSLSGESFSVAYREKAPNIVCENAYQIASMFSKFYHDNHILTEEDESKRAAWLNLCVATKTILEKHLDVLGIEAVEMM